MRRRRRSRRGRCRPGVWACGRVCEVGLVPASAHLAYASLSALMCRGVDQRYETVGDSLHVFWVGFPAAEHGAQGDDHNVVQVMTPCISVPGVLQGFQFLNHHPITTTSTKPLPWTSYPVTALNLPRVKCDSPGSIPSYY